MNNCGLKSLRNLPNLDHLLRLELSKNHIESSEIKYLLSYKTLEALDLSNNSIDSLASIFLLG